MVVQPYDYVQNCFLVHFKMVNFTLYELFLYLKTFTVCDGTRLESQHLGGRSRWISVNSRLAWSTQQAPGQPGLHNRLSQVKQKKTNFKKKIYWANIEFSKLSIDINFEANWDCSVI